MEKRDAEFKGLAELEKHLPKALARIEGAERIARITRYQMYHYIEHAMLNGLQASEQKYKEILADVEQQLQLLHNLKVDLVDDLNGYNPFACQNETTKGDN